jgi:hypothetical protein
MGYFMSLEYSMRKFMLSVTFLCIFSIFLVSPTVASVYAINGSEIPSENLTVFIREDPLLVSGDLPTGQVLLFWSLHCGACHGAIEFLDTFGVQHPEMILESYDISNSTENRTVYDSYKEKYNRRFFSTPSIIVGNLTLEGNQDIRNHLGEVLALQQEYKESTGIFSGFFSSFFKTLGI